MQRTIEMTPPSPSQLAMNGVQSPAGSCHHSSHVVGAAASAGLTVQLAVYANAPPPPSRAAAPQSSAALWASGGPPPARLPLLEQPATAIPCRHDPRGALPAAPKPPALRRSLEGEQRRTARALGGRIPARPPLPPRDPLAALIAPEVPERKGFCSSCDAKPKPHREGAWRRLRASA